MINYKLIPGRKVKETAKLVKKEKATISIITPFYNGGKTLMETANTVFSQTYPFFEWIIVDDGSKDKESLKKLEELEKLDSRIKIFHKENGGPSVARDYGISKANNSSKYIFFLDCDDMMENNMLECLYWALETHPDASFAYTSMTNFGDNEYVWDQYLTVDREKEENVICISSMVRKDDLLEVGCFGLKEKGMYEDWNLWLKLLAKGKKPIKINAPLFWYRISNTGEFSRAKDNHKQAMKYIDETASSIKDDVYIIQFPRSGDAFIDVNFDYNMVLPMYKKESKKTIMFIFPWMTIGGADVFNLELIKRLNKHKYNIIVLTTLPKENELRQEFYEYSNECYDMSTFIDRKDYIVFVDYIIKSRNVDIVFNSNSTYGYAMLPFIKSKNKNIVIMDYVHSVDLKDPRGGFGSYTRDFDSCIDMTYTCNNFTKNQLMRDFDKEKVETLYIGTDHERFNPDNIDKISLRKKYNIPINSIIITFIARLSEEKRPDLFVDIANKLLKKRNNLHFVIAGDGPLFKVTKKRIKSYGITNNISMLGMIDSNISHEIYGMSDLTINCSSLEGLALTSYESLAMGVPIVSTSVGGQTELIDNTVGRIVPFHENMTKEQGKEELENYVSATEDVLDNLDKLKCNARNRILKGFTLNIMKDKFEKIFDSILPSKVDIDHKLAISIYKSYVDSLYLEYDWFCKEFNIKYGIIENNNINRHSLKYKVKSKVIKISNKYQIKNEVKIIADFLRAFITIVRDLKYFILHIIYLIKFFIRSIISVFKIIFRLIKIK
ncbi:MAG: glycosyltransferase [Bacilli bacterium]|nr:glycosyltransferase [Bacilli bacterium]